MASTNYNINVNTSGAIVNITNLQQRMGGLESSANSVGAALAAMVSLQTVKELTNVLDAATNLQNRLSTLKTNGQTTGDMFNLMSSSAMKLGVSLNDLGNSYASIANATKDLGYSQQTNIMLNETLTKSLLLNGATQQQVNSAYYQFGQIMAKGKSEGDDFNSMLEAAPGIIRSMSDQLGVTTGALRYMSQQGKLTAEVWKNAMAGSAESIDKAFKERMPTISQSMERLKNAFEIKTTSLDQTYKISESISLALIKIANAVLDVIDFFEKWGHTIAVVGTIFGSFFLAFSIISKITTTILALGAAWSSFVTWIAPTITAIRALSPVMSSLAATLRIAYSPVMLLVSGFFLLSGAIGNVLNAIFGLFGGKETDKVKTYQSELDKLNKRLGIDNVKANNDAAAASNKKTEADLKNADAVKNALKGLKESYGEYAKSAQASIETIGKTRNEAELINAKKDAYKTFYDQVGKLRDEYVKNDPKLSPQDAEKRAIGELTGEYEKQIGVIEQLNAQKQQAVNADILKNALRDLGQTYSDTIKNMQSEIAAIPLFGAQAEQFQVLKQAADEYYSAIRKLQEEFRQNGTAGTEAEKAAIDALTQSYQSQVEQLKLLNAEKEKALRAQALLKYEIEQSINVEDELQNIQSETARSTMTELQKKYYDLDQSAMRSAQAAIRAEQARRGEMDETGRAFKKLSPSEVKAYYDAATKGSAQLRAEMKRQYDESRTFATGWKQAFNEYVDNATNAANQAKSLFTKFTSGLEDALVNLVKTGKFSWKEFVASMAEDLLRSQIKQTLAGILGLITGEGTGGTGGILGAIGSIFGLGGSTGAGATGKTKNDPLYVYDVTSGGGGLGSLLGGTSGTKSGESTSGIASIGKSLWNALGLGGAKEPEGTFGVLKSDENSAIGNMLRDLGDGLTNIGGKIYDSVGNVLGPVGQAIKDGAGNVLGFLGDIGGTLVDAGGSVINAIGGTVGNLFTLGKDAISPFLSFLGGAGSSILSTLGGAVSGIVDLVSGAGNTLDAIGKTVGGLVGSAFGPIGSLVGSTLGSFTSDIVDGVSSAVEWVGDLFDGLFASGGNIGAGKWGIVGEAGPEIVKGPASVFSNRDSYDMLNSSGSAQNVSVTYNINAVDARSFKELLAADPSYLYAVTQLGARSRGF